MVTQAPVNKDRRRIPGERRTEKNLEKGPCCWGPRARRRAGGGGGGARAAPQTPGCTPLSPHPADSAALCRRTWGSSAARSAVLFNLLHITHAVHHVLNEEAARD